MFRGFVSGGVGWVLLIGLCACCLWGLVGVVSWLVCDGLGGLMVWVWCDISCGFCFCVVWYGFLVRWVWVYGTFVLN